MRRLHAHPNCVKSEKLPPKSHRFVPDVLSLIGAGVEKLDFDGEELLLREGQVERGFGLDCFRGAFAARSGWLRRCGNKRVPGPANHPQYRANKSSAGHSTTASAARCSAVSIALSGSAAASER